MKKLSLSLMLFSMSLAASAQWHVGLTLSPGISGTRMATESDTLSIKDIDRPLRLLAGIFVEKELRENYFFQTGINFISKKYSYDIRGESGNSRYQDEFTVQYIQVPAGLRLHTNEISLDLRAYFRLGASLDIRIHDTIDDLDGPLVTKVGLGDISMISSAGVEFKLGTSTRVFGGFAYQRAFINQASNTLAMDGKLFMRGGLIGLETGIIF